MKTLIISPTYNEKENILELMSQIWQVNSEYDILIIDDNSPDGTGDIVKNKMKDHSNLYTPKTPKPLVSYSKILF